MNGAEFVRTIIGEMHGAMIADIKDLTPEHLTWKPAPGANPIGFLFWHYVRTEDNIVHGLIGKPSVWQAEEWHEKLGMDAIHEFDGNAIGALGPISHLRLNIFPDGGVSRLRLFGRPA